MAAVANEEGRGPQIPFLNVRMACTCHEVVQGQQVAESQARRLLRVADGRQCMMHEHVQMPPQEQALRARKLDLLAREREGGERPRPPALARLVETATDGHLPTRSPPPYHREPSPVHPFASTTQAGHPLLAKITPVRQPDRSSSFPVLTLFRICVIALGAILGFLAVFTLAPFLLLPALLFIGAGLVPWDNFT